ncbi:MAG: hypothetical protein ACI8W8_004817 [Rhodothermales bacterium]|jgi:hypothetical protein
MPAKRPYNLLPALTLLGIFTILSLPYLQGDVHAGYDLREQFIPWRVAWSVALERGELGLWNPFLGRGFPHHGEGQTGLLHFEHWAAYRFLPVQLAIVLELLLVYPFAFLGMALFLRSSQLRGTSVVVGAGCFTFSTFVFSHSAHVNMIWIYAHLPWCVWALWRGCATGKPRWGALMGLLYASMLLLGHPQMLWMNSLLVGGGMLWQLLAKSAHARRGTVFAVIGIAAGSLMGVIQLLPTMELLANSPRAGMIAAEYSNFSMHPLSFLIQANPLLLQDLSVPDWIYSSSGRKFMNSHEEFPCYLGASLLTLEFVAGVLLWPLIKTRFSRAQLGLLAGSALLLIVLMLGRYGGLDGLLQSIPLAGKFRAPVRYISVLLFMHSAAVAWLLFHLREAPKQKTPAIVWLPLVITVGVATWALLDDGAIHREDQVMHLASAAKILVGPLICGLATVALILRNPLSLALLACLLLADMPLCGLRIPHDSPRASMASIAEARDALVAADPQFRGLAQSNEAMMSGVALASGYFGIPPLELLEMDPKAGDPARVRHHLRLASVKQLHVFEGIIPLPDALPRLRLVSELRHAEDPLAPRDDAATVALCRPDAAPELIGPPLEPGEFAEFAVNGADHLEIALAVTHPRLLVLSDRCWPGWMASVDGKPREILPLYAGAIRGLLVNPGEQHVTMRYRPTNWGLGIGATILGVVILLILLAVDYRPKAACRES